MKRIAAVMTCLALLAGCDDRRDVVEEAVTQMLRDPESARFSDEVFIAGQGRGLVACGYVNAKNSFGGYTGLQPFMVWQDRVYMGEREDAIDACCSAVYAAKLEGQKTLSQEGSRACFDAGHGTPSPVLLQSEM